MKYGKQSCVIVILVGEMAIALPVGAQEQVVKCCSDFVGHSDLVRS
jgi:hypothetical protein